MSTRKSVKVLTSGPIVSYTLSALHFTGSESAAVFLSACIYWTEWAEKKGRDSFWKTHAEWEQEFGLSRKQVDTARSLLEPHGILRTWVTRSKSQSATHYQIDMERLGELAEEYKRTGQPIARLMSHAEWHKTKKTKQSANVPKEHLPNVPEVQQPNAPKEHLPNVPEVQELMFQKDNLSISTVLTTVITSSKTREERDSEPQVTPPERARSQKKDPPRSEPEPEAIEHQPPQPEPNPSSLVAKEATPVGPNFPPPAAENLQKIVPIRAGNSAANFEARWNRSKHPWILPDGKIHPAMVASYALSYPGVSRLPNGQINEPMITCVINRKTRSEADLPEMVALWEQAQRGGESDPQYGAIASRLPRTRQQIQDDRQAKTDAAWAAIEADYQQRQRAAL